MSLRLAAAKALPGIRASQRPKSWRLPSLRGFSQASRLYTISHDDASPSKQADNVKASRPSAARPKRPSQFISLKDPNDWCISPDTEQRPNDTILLHRERKQELVLNHHALRDACECDICVDPHSGQKNFGTTDLPDTLSVLSRGRLEDGSLEVVWDNDFLSTGKPHKSLYPAQTLKGWFGNKREGVPQLPVPILWDKSLFEASTSMVKYDDWMSGGPGFHAALAQLWNYGLVFIDGVPKSEESVVTVANQIGHIYETFYGRTWDVRSKPRAENVAYTNTFLGLHQDLLYMSDPPRIQFLHCLENTCEGGDSIFSDAHRAGNLIAVGPRDVSSALSSRRLRYHYKKDGHFYEQVRKVFDPRTDRIWWSPPFQSPDQPSRKSAAAGQKYASWLAAAKKFRGFLEDERWLYEYKLKPGQCVVFDNLRVLHGRRGFDTSAGSRWLKGTYVSRDEWKSKVMMLAPEITAASGESTPDLPSQARTLADQHAVW